MGSYVRGDVLLAPVRFGRGGERKIRPVVVMDREENGELIVSPVSSRPPSDSPCLSLRIEDFAEGGLDLFSESYLLISRICRITPADVAGKKGRLRPGVLDAGMGS
jgi:mRNA interferase MazF